MNRHRSNIADGLHVPDFGKQLFLREHMIRILGQKRQKIKLLGGEIFFFSIHINPSGCFINLQSPDFDNIIGRHSASDEPLIPRHMSLHPGHHLAGAEWFGNIIVCSQSQSADFIYIIFFRGYHNNRGIFAFPNFFANFKSVHSRKHQIQNIQIKIFF